MMEEKKNYEISYLIKSESGWQQIQAVLETSQSSLDESAGVKASLVNLSYPIDKLKSAYLGNILFSVDSKNIKKITDELKTNSDIARFMIVTVPKEASVGSKRYKGRRFDVLRPEVQLVQTKVEDRQSQSSNDASEQIKKDFTPKLDFQVGRKPAAASNEDLEKKLEEILK